MLLACLEPHHYGKDATNYIITYYFVNVFSHFSITFIAIITKSEQTHFLIPMTCGAPKVTA
jgi:hypothetical protein